MRRIVGLENLRMADKSLSKASNIGRVFGGRLLEARGWEFMDSEEHQSPVETIGQRKGCISRASTNIGILHRLL